MFPTFFRHKMREVAAFLKIMKGKATKNDQMRSQGVNDALNAMKDERQIYEGEKEEAMRGRDSDLKRNEDPAIKVLRESGGQDISAI